MPLQPGKQGTATSASGGKDGDDDDDDDTPPPVVAPRPEHTKSVSLLGDACFCLRKRRLLVGIGRERFPLWLPFHFPSGIHEVRDRPTSCPRGRRLQGGRQTEEEGRQDDR